MTPDEFKEQVSKLHGELGLAARPLRARWADDLKLSWRGVLALLAALALLPAWLLERQGFTGAASLIVLLVLGALVILALIAAVQFVRLDRAADLSQTFVLTGQQDAELLPKVLAFDVIVIEYVAHDYRDRLQLLEGALGPLLGAWRSAGVVATASAALALYVSLGKDVPSSGAYLPLFIGVGAGLLIGGLAVDAAAMPLRRRRDLLLRAVAVRGHLP